MFQEPKLYINLFLFWTEQFGNSPSFYLSELLMELSDTEGKILSVNLRSIIVNSHGENQFRDLLTASLRIWQEPCILSEVILRNDVYMTRRNFKGQHRNYIIRQITKYEITSNWNCSFLKAKTSGWGFWTFGRGQISPLAHREYGQNSQLIGHCKEVGHTTYVCQYWSRYT